MTDLQAKQKTLYRLVRPCGVCGATPVLILDKPQDDWARAELTCPNGHVSSYAFQKDFGQMFKVWNQHQDRVVLRKHTAYMNLIFPVDSKWHIC